jgi:hypothetical protein
MTDFSNLSALKITEEASAEFTFFGIAGEPSLTCRPATQENKPFFNAVLAKNKQAQRKLKGRRAQAPTAATLAEARVADIELFVEYIVIGWSGVQDAKGKDVKFSKDVCRQFLEAIPGDMFDELRVFCLEIANFREEMDTEELEELSGN